MLLVVAAVVSAAAVVSVALRAPSPRERFFGMRADLSIARQAADSCSSAIDREQASFEAYISRVDSMRGRIGDLESLDRRGVPADSYPAYLETVDSFNATVPEWEAVAETLRVHRQACEDIVRVHNAMADSARHLAEQAELLDSARGPSDK